MNIELNKIRSITFVTFLLITIAIICPGIMFIFMFGKHLFIEVDTFKVILLSVSITTPIWLINSFLISRLWDNNEDHDWEEILQLTGIIGSVLSIPVIYIPILIKFFFNISLENGVLLTLCLQLIIGIIALFLIRSESRYRLTKN